jgi:hypothetical protein
MRLQQPHEPRCEDRLCPACWAWIGDRCHKIRERFLVERDIRNAKGKVVKTVPFFVGVALEEE